MADVYRTKNGKVVSIIDMRKMIDDYRKVFKQMGFKATGANALIRLAAFQAGTTWAKIFIPKRFNPAYARGVLGYGAGKEYEAWKSRNAGRMASWKEFRGFPEPHDDLVRVAYPQPSPFVLTGGSKTAVLGATPKVVVTERGGQGRCSITVPLGMIAFKRASIFTKVAMVELARFSDEFERNLRKSIRPLAGAGYFPKDFKFTASRRGVTIDERVVSNAERRFG